MNSRAVSEQFRSYFRAILEQFRIDCRSVWEQFGREFQQVDLWVGVVGGGWWLTGQFPSETSQGTIGTLNVCTPFVHQFRV